MFICAPPSTLSSLGGTVTLLDRNIEQAFMRSLLLFLLLTAGPAFAQFGFPTQLPKQTTEADIRNRVAQYCRLDYTGGRLSDADFEKMKSVVNWPKNPEYPLIDVVARYDVGSSPSYVHGNKWSIHVTYHLLGRFNLGQGYSTDGAGSEKEADITVQDVNGELKVVDVDPNYPRPSRAAMLKWLQEKEAAATDSATKVIYEQAVKDLSAQSGSPFAK